jgi:large subunit ribosomal protein L25
MAEGTRPSLAVDERPERGTRAIRRLRREGYVPGVVYGGSGTDCVAFKVPARQLRAALLDGSALLDLKVGSEKARPVIVKDQQIHPVRGQLLHIDLLQVRLDEKIHSTVAIELQGVEEAPGVKEGGVLEHVTRELTIEALPTDIPERIEVDVSGMDAAATMHLSEISAPDGVLFLDDPEETIIATITVPTEEPEEPELEEETELVGEEGEVPEGEEAPEEGEAAAEGGEAAEGAESEGE